MLSSCLTRLKRARRRGDSWMRLAGAALVALAGLPRPSAWAADAFSRPFGILRVPVGATNQVLASHPFEPLDDRIASVFADQMEGGSDKDASDHVLMWDALAQTYLTFWKGTDDVWRLYPESAETTNTLHAGEGFWIVNRHAVDQNVFLSGDLLLDATNEVLFVQGLNLFGYPFTAALALNDSTMAADGASGAASKDDADEITETETNASFWLLDEPGSPLHLNWVLSTNLAADYVMKLGAGYWYLRKPAAPWIWSEARPYGSFFPEGETTPMVTGLTFNASGDAATLHILTAGATGEVLDIYYQDLSAADVFAATNGWQVAASGLIPAGASLVWTDSGSGERPPVDEIHGRAYLVARADWDTDEDGLSDAAELFLHGTDPQADADADGDGLTDADEILLYGTDAHDPDSDGDGLEDGEEIADRTHPLNPDTAPPGVVLVWPPQGAEWRWVP